MYRNHINPFYYDPYNTYEYFEELRRSRGFNKIHHPFLDDDMDDWVRSDNQVNLDNQINLENQMNLMDYGPEPFAVNIEEMTIENNNYRTAVWTGNNLQLTLMSINVGEDIGLEVHPTHDQFLRIEEGSGIIFMGDSQDNLDYQRRVSDDFGIIIPAGKWHNLINTGDRPIKLYSIYAPPQHPHGTVHETKEKAEMSEKA